MRHPSIPEALQLRVLDTAHPVNVGQINDKVHSIFATQSGDPLSLTVGFHEHDY